MVKLTDTDQVLSTICCCCSVAPSCPNLCDPMDCSIRGFPFLNHLLEFSQNSRPLSQWCHPTILSSDVPFSSHPQSIFLYDFQFSSVQLLSRVRLFVTPWIAARQASLSITNSRSSPKPMSIESVMPSNHLILCHPLLLLPWIFPSMRAFSNELVLCIRWSKYWSVSLSISPSNEYSGLISFRIGWFYLLLIQGTLKSLLQHHSSKV